MVLFVWALISILVHIYGMGSFSLSYIISMSGILGASIHLFCLCYKYVKKEAFYLSKKKKCKVLWFHSKLCNVSTCHDSGNTEMPDAMETIFQAALAFGRRGGVSILSLSLALKKKESIYFSFSCI